jgi:nifR3 family TIM-barrel protein
MTEQTQLQNIWQSDQPLMVLAPMANVTDAAFRRVIAKYGKPDIMYTQFVSCDGLCSPGRDALLPDLWFDESERPIVGQFFGANPETFYKCGQLAVELGFDGFDINMGCPDKSVLKQKAGSGMILYPEQAKEVIKATKEGAKGIPVSVKTRIGYEKIEWQSWLPVILEEDVAALIVHLRTKSEMSKVPAHWELASEIASLTREYNTPFLGNGDVESLADAEAKCAEHGIDGVMLGRAIFGNPWRFNQNIRKEDLPLEEVLRVMLEHAQLFDELYGGIKSFDTMRKHFSSYVGGFHGARQVRQQLVHSESLDEVKTILAEAIGVQL